MSAHTSTLPHIKTDHSLVEDRRHKLLFRLLDYSLIIALSGFAIYCLVIMFSVFSTGPSPAP